VTLQTGPHKPGGEPEESGAAGAPFVVEGDEYDSAFFEKTPKFWQYAPRIAEQHDFLVGITGAEV